MADVGPCPFRFGFDDEDAHCFDEDGMSDGYLGDEPDDWSNWYHSCLSDDAANTGLDTVCTAGSTLVSVPEFVRRVGIVSWPSGPTEVPSGFVNVRRCSVNHQRQR